MNKLLKIFVTLISLLMLIFNISSFASDISVKVNDKPINFDVKPTIIKDRAMVPLRQIFEAIGATVAWEKETKTILAFKGDKTITLQIDNNVAFLGDKKVDLEVAPIVIEGRTLVPIRFIIESLDAEVNWDEATSTISIYMPVNVGYKSITIDETKKKMEAKAVLIDVRTQNEYNEGHIKDSILIPNDVIAEKITSTVPDKSTEIIVYCRSGARALTAAKTLVKLGYTNVFNLGGIDNQNYELVK